jgi:HSP20 family molecular chaperone IbpA
MASDPSDPASKLWERARTILDEAQRIERELCRVRAVPLWVPPVDVLLTATEVWVLIALPGVENEGVEVALDGARLVVCGQRRVPPALARAAVHRLEIPRGRFERRIDLPPGEYELRRRDLVHGVLALGFARR